jgi:hypothetical protein
MAGRDEHEDLVKLIEFPAGSSSVDRQSMPS